MLILDEKWITISVLLIPLGVPSMYLVLRLIHVNFHGSAINKCASIVLIINGSICQKNYLL